MIVSCKLLSIVYHYAHKLVFPFWKHFINSVWVMVDFKTILGNTNHTFPVSFLTDSKKKSNKSKIGPFF